MKFYSFILLTLVFLLLSACIPQSTIVLHDGSVVLQTDEYNQIILHAQNRETRNRFFSGLHLKQQILQGREGTFFVLETVNLDNDYEFRQTVKRTIEIVFETRNIHKILSSGTLDLYQLILSDGRVLNIIAQKEGIFTMKFLYGMDMSGFEHILKQLSTTMPKVYTDPLYIARHIEDAVVTKWDIVKVQFYPLVGRMPRLNPMF